MDERLLQVTRHGVTRVPAELWLGMAILVRYWALMLVVAASAPRDSSVVLLLGDGGVSWLLMVLELPVVVLMVAAGNRRPDASGVWRVLWRIGRPIIWLTALLNVTWTTVVVSHSDYWSWWPEYLLLGCAGFDAFIAAMVASPFYKMLFAEFPDASADPSDISKRGAHR